MSKKSKKNSLPYCTSCHRKALCHHLKAMPSRLTKRQRLALLRLEYDKPNTLSPSAADALLWIGTVEKDPTSNRYRPTETGEWLKEYMNKGEKMPTTKKRQTAQNYGRVDKVIGKAINKAQKEWCPICRHRNCHHKRRKAFDHLMALPGIDKAREEAQTQAKHFAPITVRVPWKPIELRNVPFLEGR